MHSEKFQFFVQADDRTATQEARRLADELREISGVIDAEREKGNEDTMDLGAIVTIVASSGATIAIAKGVADWLRRTRGTRLVIEKDSKSGSIKAQVENIDSETAARITEIISSV